MTAFADTIVFMTLIMMAVSVTVLTSLPGEDGNISSDAFLDILSGTEIRLSDMTDLEDDSLVHLPDAMAYSVSHDSSVPGYLESLLDTVYGPGRYFISYSFGEDIISIGEPREFFRSYASMDCTVSVGGHLSVELELYA